jgi:hypothetical protein
VSDVERLYLGRLLDKPFDREFGQRLKDDLTEEDIRAMLRAGPLRFVEFDVGRPPRWIPLNDCFSFWKTLHPNLHVSEKRYLEDYPGCFFYIASEWTGLNGGPLIVLEKFH